MVAVLGLGVLLLAAPTAARAAEVSPGPVLVLVLLVLAAELMPVELDGPAGPPVNRGARDATTMSQPFAFALVLGWGVAAGVVALGLCSALADLLGGKAVRKILFNSAQLALSLGAAGGVYELLGGDRGSGPVGLAAFAAAALDPAERREFVDMAVRQGTRLKELIEQLLLAARFEQTGREQVERQLVDAAEVAREAGLAAGVCHPDRRIEVAVGDALPVHAASRALLQVLGNLLDNAAKYSPDGTPIRLEASRAGALAVLAVEDAGPGVPRPERDRIFERFTQLDSGATRRAGGVGLGLYIARQLAQAQGGELLVGEPVRAGAGARFELRLPLAEEASPGTGPGQDGQAYDRPA